MRLVENIFFSTIYFSQLTKQIIDYPVLKHYLKDYW